MWKMIKFFWRRDKDLILTAITAFLSLGLLIFTIWR